MRTHLEHLAAALGFLVFALFISYFGTGTRTFSPLARSSGTLTPLPSETRPIAATTTVPTFTLATSTLETLFPTHLAVRSAAVPPAKAVVPAKAKPVTSVPPPPSPKPATPVAPDPAPEAPAAPSGSSQKTIVARSIVNILCISHVPTLRSTSSSGEIIDSRGIVLTVAHVAQSLLLEEYLGSNVVSCTLRTGSPAKDTYLAKPIYVPEAWVHANATTLISSQPTGTGAYDYALLAITRSVSGKALPGSYAALPLSTSVAHVGDTVFIGSYGAQSLTSAQIRSALSAILVSSTIQARYTLGTNTQDVLGIPGSEASQQGSSGGVVVNDANELIGLITTSQVVGDLNTREMRVITPSYLRRSFKADTGKDLETYYTTTSIPILVEVYADTARELGAYIAQAISLTKE